MSQTEYLLWLPVTAFICCGLLHVLAIRTFPKWGLLDFPQRYNLQRARIPYPTGILAILVFLAFFRHIEEPSLQKSGLAFSIALLGFISFVDDRNPLHWSIRLLTQIGVSVLIFITGTRIYSLTNPLEAISGIETLYLDTVIIESTILGNPSIVGGVFTIIWLGLTMNALNWFDGIQGQVSSLSSIGFLTIGFLSLSDRVGDPHLASIAFILAGIAIASAAFDFPPGKVLMGDTGAMFFGLMLGVLTIYAGGKVATGFLVLGVPLIDSIIVIFYRLRKGVSPFKGNNSNEHLHHRLLAKGWSERQIILLSSGLGAAFGVTALFLSTTEKFLAAVVLFIVMISLSVYSGTKKRAA